nr:immunoglobulin heavy chain junction region [Macaca mulatta]
CVRDEYGRGLDYW